LKEFLCAVAYYYAGRILLLIAAFVAAPRAVSPSGSRTLSLSVSRTFTQRRIVGAVTVSYDPS
jgi:hypothetical protein